MFWDSRIKELERRVHNLEVDMVSMRDYLPRLQSDKTTSFERYLEKHNITQQEVAKALGISQAQISRIINGSFIPNKANMLKIYSFTNKEVTPNDFYGVGNGIKANS